MKIVIQIAYGIVLVAALHAGVVGLFEINIIDSVFGMEGFLSRILAVFSGFAALVLIVTYVRGGCVCKQTRSCTSCCGAKE
ncbi:MAG: hypothetical protein RL150_285 [Candidatus Parcubacteria bacterium]|jgi:uncharacterized membrane protein YuzA (DUF378 family)